MIDVKKAEYCIERPSQNEIRRVSRLIKDRMADYHRDEKLLIVAFYDVYNGKIRLNVMSDHVSLSNFESARSTNFVFYVSKDATTEDIVNAVNFNMESKIEELCLVELEASVEDRTEELERLISGDYVSFKWFFPMSCWTKDNLEVFGDVFLNN